MSSYVGQKEPKPNLWTDFALPNDQKQLLQSVATLGRALLRMPNAIWLLDFHSQALRIYASTGLRDIFVNQSSACVGDGGIISQVIETGSTQVVTSIENDARSFNDDYPQAVCTSIYCVPIQFRNQTLGVFEVFCIDGRGIRANEFEYLQSLADMARVIVENSYHSKGSQELTHIARNLSAIPDFGRAMQVLVESACELTGGDSATLVLLDKQTNEFTVGAQTPVREDVPIRLPRAEGGLTRHIIETAKPVMVSNTLQDARVGKDVIEEGVLSLIGVRVQMEERIGVLYVNGTHTSQFNDYGVHLLETLADYASVALSWVQLLLRPSVRMEEATSSLFNLGGVVEQVCVDLEASQGFHFVALQLRRVAERVIETVYGTGIAEKWGGLAWKHYLEEDQSLRDIQADVTLNHPPCTEIIAGWDKRFDRWIYDTFGHSRLLRIFVPMVIVRDHSGRPIEDWFEHCELEITPAEPREGGWAVGLRMPLPKGENSLEVIGTVEAGYALKRGIGEGSHETSSITQEEFRNRVEQLINPARALFTSTSRHALTIWRARLPHALQIVTECAMRILGGDSASIHFPYDSQDNRYVYELSCGRIGHAFLNDYPAREDDLGQQAIAEKKPKYMPDLSRGQDASELESLNPQAYERGIRALAVFPLIAGENTGALYIYFHRQHHFTQDEIDWVQLFVNWAADAIGHYATYRQMRERARQLASLHSIVHSIVGRPNEKDLLRHVAWNTLNILAADVVTIYEYIKGEDTFVTPPAIGGRLIHDAGMQTEINAQDSPYLVIRNGKNIYSPRSNDDPVFNKAAGNRSNDRPTPFVVRERINSSAAILLKVGDEPVGVMFINYRRPHNFSEEERNTIEILASAAAITLKNRRLLEVIGEEFGAGIREIITTLDLPQVLSLVVERAVKITGAHLGVISLLDPATQELVIQARYPENEPVEPSWTRIKIGEGITGWVAMNRKPALVNNLRTDPRHRNLFLRDGSALCVPLQDKDGRILGVLGVKSSELAAFSRVSQRKIEVLANYAVIGIQNAESQSKLAALKVGGFASQLVHWMAGKVLVLRANSLEIQQTDSVDTMKERAAEMQAVTDRVMGESLRLLKWNLTELELVDLREAIRDARALIQLPVNIEFTTDLSTISDRVCGNTQQLIHVFVNLIQNSIDAMPAGGQLTIKGENSELEGVSWTVIRVSDSGIGIPQEALDRIFQLGTSTKHSVAGRLGFGLWWTQTYVEQLGGRLTVESESGMGTVFTLLLPTNGDCTGGTSVGNE